MLEAHVDVALGEAIKPAAAAHNRLAPAHWISGIWPGLGFAAGVILAWAVNYGLFRAGLGSELANTAVWLICVIFGLLVGFQFAARRHLAAFLASLRRLGSPPTFLTRLRIDDEGLSADNNRLSIRASWPAIHFLVKTDDHWVAQADSMTIVIPRRAFAEPAAETAFIRAILERISPEARRRSDNASHEQEA